MGSNKGLKSAITCFLILGLVLAQVLHVEGKTWGKTCCQGYWGRQCYEACPGARSLQPACANLCGCIIIRGDSCPHGYPSLHNHFDSDTPNAIQFCNVGCKSSVCDNMNNESTLDVELCGSACASFCNKISVSASVAA
ncbi:hypothetical protein ACQ4PT_049726 [Festuca glaucescens]